MSFYSSINEPKKKQRIEIEKQRVEVEKIRLEYEMLKDFTPKFKDDGHINMLNYLIVLDLRI